ncbi:MarR family winged helix-turn-helix transcriptional regulator [Frondihabitans australicus]|nr:MarR family transcriptional regulator [Frondihabitans australicus]
MTEPSPTSDGPMDKLERINRAQIRAGQDWIRGRGLTLQQAFVLNYLTDHSGAMQREIAEATQTTPANISGVLRVLQSRGLIERRTDEGDDRSKRVFATPDGVALLAGRDDAMAAVDDRLLSPLSSSEQATLDELLGRIAAALD